MPKILYALFAILALSACNTIGGAGQDLQSAGGAISDEAQDVEQGM